MKITDCISMKWTIPTKWNAQGTFLLYSDKIYIKNLCSYNASITM